MACRGWLPRSEEYNSCRHRACPQCASLERERWLLQWKEQLLDCSHYHTVFTTPHDLSPLWRFNKRLFANLLFAAATWSLEELLSDERYLGAKIGMLAALHTWSQTLAEHVHLHILVTAGGLTADGPWRAVKKSCLLPREVLMRVFRGRFRKLLLRALERGALELPPNMTEAGVRSLLNRVGRVTWNVKILERYDHGVGVATYLARYLKGGPIGNGRLVSLRDGRVYFRQRVSSSGGEARGRRAVTSLPVDEFQRRLLEHVPPKGFHTVRGYGLYSSNRHSRLPAARAALGQAPLAEQPPQVDWQTLCASMGRGAAACCPVCGERLECFRVTISVRPSHSPGSHSLERPLLGGRSPPTSLAAGDQRGVA
ncbi:MAG: transposase [Planctomycetaceae bacterium]|nr:transposase [Planctomycetales bacterium]MCB9924665.1 transposase [Planctomycetaceae bacterium]